MSDIVVGAENLIRASGWGGGHIVVRLVAALKAARAENGRLLAQAREGTA
jgi:hypothetical protein